MATYAYYRVSTQTQAEQNGIEMQISEVERYCKENDISIDGVFKDEGISGTRADREGLNDLLATLEKDDKVIEPEHDIKALFHCWSHKSELVGESPCYGGHPDGQISETFGIVEYEDGTIHEVDPTSIRFVDNAMSEYAFLEMEGINGN